MKEEKINEGKPVMFDEVLGYTNCYNGNRFLRKHEVIRLLPEGVLQNYPYTLTETKIVYLFQFI